MAGTGSGKDKIVKTIVHIAVLVALVVVLLFILTWAGVIQCRAIPGWCDVYWGVIKFPTGQPEVVIVYGDSGLGNPELLQTALADPAHLGVRARMLRLDSVSIGNLKKYDLVIVTKARQMHTKKMRAFVDYVSQGGRLVWTGDAGVELGLDENADSWLYEDDLDDNATHRTIGPWARKRLGKTVRIDLAIGANYKTTFCEAKDCENEMPFVGTFDIPDRENRFVKALRSNLPVYADFAIVEERDDVTLTEVLLITFGAGGDIVAKSGKRYRGPFPAILSASPTGLGERVAYYAIPPEQLVREELVDKKYYSILENMYLGMLK